jgi:hypothetical protein
MDGHQRINPGEVTLEFPALVQRAGKEAEGR